MRCFPRSGAALFDRVAQTFDPNASLRRRAAEHAAGPDKFERRELTPRLIALDHGLRNEVAAHCRRVHSMAAETAGEPNARAKFADLRHAMDGDSQSAGPSVVDIDIAQLRIGFLDVGFQLPDISARIARP